MRRRRIVQWLRYIAGAACCTYFVFLTARYIQTNRSQDDNSNEIHIFPDASVDINADHVSTDLGKKIDWHNYQFMSDESRRRGPGEQGSSVMTSGDEASKKDQLYKENGFNALASDKIALDRSVKDIRHTGCKTKLYYEHLPSVSVIVPFHNEHFSTLIRTATSVLNRSPEHLIKEIILVDDFSSKEALKDSLDAYLQEHLPKVRVVRAPKREGLIRARLLGAKAATGAVLIFLDSHSEANTNWLPPLLEPIAEDYRTATCPFIDIIDYETFEYRAQDEGARGAFDWELYYKRLPLLPEDLKNPTEPFKSPVMAGGLFAISRKFFWELGGYDEGLDVWGGEQYELSFKIWQCGGKLVDTPCSRVGHIYRKFAPFSNPGVGDFVGRNYRRVAEVWMDEYAEFVYKKRPHYKHIDAGDLSKQRALRENLKCKSFKWFMTEVAFDQMERYPPIEPPDFAWGEIRNVGGNLCIDTRFKSQNDRFNLEPCIKDNADNGGEQSFVLTWHKDIRPRGRAVCFDVSSSDNKTPVILYNCHNMQGNQQWKYNSDTKSLFHPVSSKCLDCDTERKEIFVNECDRSKLSQQWLFENYNVTLLLKL
ncbi:putative polypeptide N-acetylgalactosaminyltransferase 10 [Paramacrobiotus metropolitanus]|uniref:putative polypeptide N-acetylgalactosaminyltransferase 10 n=1 Tax=Paramacrobiotus metropolitanus TaxID=2943436 RepID=UPI0024461D19|nr:putative polypeptide N-acetylgalactosaminyltransferase 10 [Paramacrobiotus metropolitanus]XP_055351704.1 putative polypeptide N-acetylgalactosaminyltransferase 10 [Paramacrobiotus metropolitanus]XP_055351705.1 putative polypeptide N-acetylgalactosaminyltransferase 10 [Paramacrobiotus metropolitanus]XP_055351706.1 putative polypeptide N-acetylgalactosaminyltransferase 10 [Paramacrobiotus metropolitanus]XP_055351707.1 putative polypeptide N-acetylgalactosaminyltransferase 10 [Paramacrobiotus m